MRRLAALAAATVLAACSGSAPDAGRTARDAPTRIGAADLVRAYTQDADEADVAFAGHPLVISGDVAGVDPASRHMLLTTGSATERLPAIVASDPQPVRAHDFVTLRCDRIERVADRPRASGCAVTAIIPARIAQGG